MTLLAERREARADSLPVLWKRRPWWQHIPPAGPPGGMVVHSFDGVSWGPSTCLKCGWRGSPTFIAGEVQHDCPACGPAVDDLAEHARELIRQRNRGTVRRATPKVGRNDPCPCESGRKYKRCHGVSA